MKRLFAAAALLIFGVSSAAVAAKEEKEVRIGYQAASTMILLTKAKGYYDEEFGKLGLKVKYNLFLSGPPMIEALAGDRLDFVHTGDMPPVSGRAAGIDIKVIANAGLDPAHNALLVAPDSPVKKVNDLKGKKVGAPVGSSAHHFVYLLLAKHGLKPSDIRLVNLPAPDLAKALETKNVDAIATWEPFVANIELSGTGKVLASSDGVKRAVNVYLTRNEFGKANLKAVEAFIRATKRGIDFFRRNPKAAQEAIAAEAKFPLPVVQKITKRYNWGLAVSDKDRQALGSVKDFLKETKVLKKDFELAELFDPSYLRRTGLK